VKNGSRAPGAYRYVPQTLAWISRGGISGQGKRKGKEERDRGERERVRVKGGGKINEGKGT